MYDYMKRMMVMVAGLLILGLSGPGVAAQEELRIGILQYVEHDSLNQSYQGFVDELAAQGYQEGDNLILNYINASGDSNNLQSMSENVAKGVDYIYTIATPAAQGIANIEKEIPIYFTAVSDPVGAGLVESLEAPGGNVTGTTDAGPIQDQVDLLLDIVPHAQRIGLIYNSGEVNSVTEADRAKEAMAEAGLEVIEATVTGTNDIAQVMGSLVDQDLDAIFTVTDNTLASAMALVGDLALDAGLPLIGGSKDMALENGLATYGLDYYELGRQTAQMLLRQLESGQDTADIPVETADTLEVVINEANADALGLDLSDLLE